MPAWNFTDQQIWQIVLFLRRLPPTAAQASEALTAKPGSHYVGSAACQSCHQEIYARWQKTRMANVVRDPRTHPDAIIPDFSKPDPLLTFTKDDIAFVYGSRWKQRYFTRRGDDYYPLQAQWDITHHRWLPYHVPANADWWVPFYPTDNMQRPTGPLCDGCHSVNYDIATKNVTEWNVGCEACHGAGGDHVATPTRATIVNPARLDYVGASDTCIRCHSQGRPPANPIDGKYYDWPVGFHMGLQLSDFWALEAHKPGELSFTHFPDGTAHKNRMQGNDFVAKPDVHARRDLLFLPRSAWQRQCRDASRDRQLALSHLPCAEHADGTPRREHRSAYAPQARQHRQPVRLLSHAGDRGNFTHVNVHAHTFRFITPAETETLKIPNACTLCHADKAPAWAADVLKSWKERSPWRMQ